MPAASRPRFTIEAIGFVTGPMGTEIAEITGSQGGEVAVAGRSRGTKSR
jgi:hypothetical protein